MLAGHDIRATAPWVKASSLGKFQVLMHADWIYPKPFAALLSIAPDAPARPQVNFYELADGGVGVHAARGQRAALFAAKHIERPVGRLAVARRMCGTPVRAIAARGRYAEVLSVALSSPSRALWRFWPGKARRPCPRHRGGLGGAPVGTTDRRPPHHRDPVRTPLTSFH